MIPGDHARSEPGKPGGVHPFSTTNRASVDLSIPVNVNPVRPTSTDPKSRGPQDKSLHLQLYRYSSLTISAKRSMSS